MKKFIGRVNGVVYTNREDFNEAVKKAMENHSSNLAITSYEEDVPDGKEIEGVKKPEDVKKKNIVSENDFTIELESDKETVGDKIEYRVPDGLEEKLHNCDNKEEVVKKINEKIKSWNELIEGDWVDIANFENDIMVADRNIRELKEKIGYLEAGVRYYSKLLNYVNGCEEEKKIKITTNDDTGFISNFNGKENDLFNDIFNSFGTQFSRYLRSKGFFDI